uniref:uncharacterized protein LOC108950680 isoform X2 n=1 Tax=Ciona intestinalis TaxID=7719 RepID=UPI000EF4C2D3|nr:uncharacterized protein LOC108950680 isoform X2 [Ciona intestinalis]|eukprot:XP_026695449.1 uncharacterized protein LOC108950680 isoform X2 [Ciona intestinalis]
MLISGYGVKLGLSETEKEGWKDKVDQQPCNEEMDDKQRNSLITKQLKIMTQVTETLDKDGVVMGGLSYFNGTFNVFGTSTSMSYFKQGNIQREFLSHMNQINLSEEKENKHEVLRKLKTEVQKIYNENYSEAVGQTARMPYSKIYEFGLKMNGLPGRIPFKCPSGYGPAACKKMTQYKENLKLLLHQ